MKNTFRRVLSLFLSVSVAAGLFAGMSLTTYAASGSASIYVKVTRGSAGVTSDLTPADFTISDFNSGTTGLSVTDVSATTTAGIWKVDLAFDKAGDSSYLPSGTYTIKLDKFRESSTKSFTVLNDAGAMNIGGSVSSTIAFDSFTAAKTYTQDIYLTVKENDTELTTAAKLSASYSVKGKTSGTTANIKPAKAAYTTVDDEGAWKLSVTFSSDDIENSNSALDAGTYTLTITITTAEGVTMRKSADFTVDSEGAVSGVGASTATPISFGYNVSTTSTDGVHEVYRGAYGDSSAQVKLDETTGVELWINGGKSTHYETGAIVDSKTAQVTLYKLEQTTQYDEAGKIVSQTEPLYYNVTSSSSYLWVVSQSKDLQDEIDRTQNYAAESDYGAWSKGRYTATSAEKDYLAKVSKGKITPAKYAGTSYVHVYSLSGNIYTKVAVFPVTTKTTMKKVVTVDTASLALKSVTLSPNTTAAVSLELDGKDSDVEMAEQTYTVSLAKLSDLEFVGFGADGSADYLTISGSDPTFEIYARAINMGARVVKGVTTYAPKKISATVNIVNDQSGKKATIKVTVENGVKDVNSLKSDTVLSPVSKATLAQGSVKVSGADGSFAEGVAYIEMDNTENTASDKEAVLDLMNSGLISCYYNFLLDDGTYVYNSQDKVMVQVLTEVPGAGDIVKTSGNKYAYLQNRTLKSTAVTGKFDAKTGRLTVTARKKQAEAVVYVVVTFGVPTADGGIGKMLTIPVHVKAPAAE